ncbi:unnamed protein product [Closterium sp. NIES-54]
MTLRKTSSRSRYGRGLAAPPQTAETELVPSAPGSSVPAALPAARAAPIPAAPLAAPAATVPAAPPAPVVPPAAPAAPPAAPAAPAPAAPPAPVAPPAAPAPAAPPAAPVAPPAAPPVAPAAPEPAAPRQRREYHSRSCCRERGSRLDGTPRALEVSRTKARDPQTRNAEALPTFPVHLRVGVVSDKETRG